MKLWALLNLPRSMSIFILYRCTPFREEIKKDLLKAGAVKDTRWDLHMMMIKNQAFRNLFFYRTNRTMSRITKISKLFYKPWSQMSIYADRVGSGMSIFHGNSTIVFAKEIGENFSVYQQVTIGRGKSINGNDCPIIGNNVTVYAGAIVVGGIHIGDGAVIGAGAVVVSAPVRMICK